MQCIHMVSLDSQHLAEVTLSLQAHPLSVKLTVSDNGDKPPLSLQFYYLPRLEAVTVKAANADQQQLLASLFPDDAGLSLPNESAHQQSRDGSFEYDASRSDRPYL